MKISEIMKQAYTNSKLAGWPKTEKGTDIALIHSELSEALEGERKDLMDKHLPHRKQAEVEMADAVIRICNYCAQHQYDLEGAIEEKLEYNLNRPDHKIENRNEPGAKQY